MLHYTLVFGVYIRQLLITVCSVKNVHFAIVESRCSSYKFAEFICMYICPFSSRRVSLVCTHFVFCVILHAAIVLSIIALVSQHVIPSSFSCWMIFPPQYNILSSSR